MKWVLLERFCGLSGYTRQAVYDKMYKGVWVEGVHWRRRSRRIHINIEEVEKWIENGEVRV